MSEKPEMIYVVYHFEGNIPKLDNAWYDAASAVAHSQQKFFEIFPDAPSESVYFNNPYGVYAVPIMDKSKKLES